MDSRREDRHYDKRGIRNLGTTMKKNRIENILILFVFMLSCAKANDFDQSFYYNKQLHINSENYTRDSLYLISTAEQFLNLKLGYWAEFYNELKKYNEKHDSTLYYSISIDKIYYDSTYTKLYAYCIAAVTLTKDAKWPEDYDHFTSYNLMGFRDSVCEPWKVYPYYQILLSDAPNLDTLIHDLNYFYFVRLKDEKRIRDTNRDGIGESVKLGYNLNDPKFWTEYVDWKKGVMFVDSLYGFQFAYMNPGIENFIQEGLRYYTKLSKTDPNIIKVADSLYKPFSEDWHLYLWHNFLDSTVTMVQIRNSKDSLRFEKLRKDYDETLTMNDIIKIGIDYYTYKPKIDSVRYPDSLLKMYECK